MTAKEMVIFDKILDIYNSVKSKIDSLPKRILLGKEEFKISGNPKMLFQIPVAKVEQVKYVGLEF